ncbi:DUF5130 domain-containing protein [Rhodococcus triatomae]|uniref:TLP18.3, Psb32 and MOLO-1 founding protein of phosphatase n=1 Tax=Rhodococcus triatomae TaxID=300028 RepID=A0A1G8DUR3_9NOCA|nr:DUF5130 domain-containing protein [Rhodococcus triatomae]QNG18346.1 DUF5130 domain-containing protein [Rhodococcus triatomae]QNG21984.1 DUF5130 domain-containing protein [Rhodococcus triatomae]SDH61149.1 protein of unknown function [Rhodococcus triatomae]
MASGNFPTPTVDPDTLPVGSVVTSSGRISAVHRAGEPFTGDLPFGTDDLVKLDDALTAATRATKVRFNVYVGDLGADTGAGANAIFPHTPEPERSVLIAVSPNQRVVEVRGGRDVQDRVTDRIAQLGVTAAVSSFAEGDLIDGLVSALRVMSAAIAP